MQTPAETLLAKPAGGIPNDIARLKGARFVSASETEAGRRLAEALVKQMTGQDTITARFMRSEWFDFKPTHKTWLATNHKPEIRGTDHAIWDRIRLVPFEVRIPPSEVDRKLPEKLRGELSGILAWAVRGCLDWQRNGLGEPEEVKAATEAYRSEMDVLAAFLEDRCVLASRVKAKAIPLYQSYRDWCAEAGERPETQRAFGMRLTERGFERKQLKGVTWYVGVAIRENQPDPDTKVEEAEAKVEESKPSSTPQSSCKTPESRGWVDEGRPKNGINPRKTESREGNPEKGLPSSTSSTPRTPTALLQNPPDWLTNQLQRCQENRAIIKTTCSSIAYEVYGTASRWEEVRSTVEQWLEGRSRGSGA